MNITSLDDIGHPSVYNKEQFSFSVHLWQANLNLPEQQLEILYSTLSLDEQQRANRYYFEKDRKHFIAGRGILRRILGHYVNREAACLEFVYSPRGKPHLSDEGLHFNVSHSNGLAVYGVSRDRPLGVDVEYLRPLPDAEKLAQRFFCPQEYSILRSLPEDQKQLAFFHAWTCKEAFLKATGEGLAGLDEVEVSIHPDQPAKLLSIQGDRKAAKHWHLERFSPATDYVAAIAIEGEE